MFVGVGKDEMRWIFDVIFISKETPTKKIRHVFPSWEKARVNSIA